MTPRLKKAIEDLLANDPALDHYAYPEAEIEELRDAYNEVRP